MITVKQLMDKDVYKGVVVTYEAEGKPFPKVIVECDYAPLAVTLLKHALVHMEERAVFDRNPI